jgi:hypothetical protein
MGTHSEITPDGIHAGLLALFFLACVVLIAYLPVLTSHFGIMDDYSFLHDATHGTKLMETLVWGSGRPLNAVLLDRAFNAAGSIEDLAKLRAVTMAGIWLFGGALYQFTRRSGAGNLTSLALACMVVLLPSFEVFATWAQHVTTPYAATLALLAAYCLAPACTLWTRSKALSVALAVVLLLSAILVYQPVAMMFCTGILISLFAGPDSSRQWSFARLMGAATAFSMAMILGFIAFKLCRLPFIGGVAADVSRFGIVSNVPQKLQWFVAEPLLNAMNMYRVQPKLPVAVAVAALLLACAFVLFRKGRAAASATSFAYAILCIIASFAPSLVTAENWASYRSIAALGASIAALSALLTSRAMVQIGTLLPRPIAASVTGKFGGLLMLAALLLVAADVQSNVVNCFVVPNATELDNLAGLLMGHSADTEKAITIVVKPASWMNSYARPRRYDEFGLPSSIHEIYARHIVELATRRMGLFPHATVLTAAEAGPEATKNAALGIDGSFLVDFPALVTSGSYTFRVRDGN